MYKQVTVTYTEELVRFAVKKFWARLIGITGVAATAFLAIAAVYFVLVGDRSWFTGFLGAVLIVTCAVGYLSYRNYVTQSLDKLTQMGSGKAEITFTDERLIADSEIGKSEIPWKTIEKIWAYPEIWLVFLSKHNFFTLPVATIDEGTRNFIRQKIRENGGKIEEFH